MFGINTSGSAYDHAKLEQMNYEVKQSRKTMATDTASQPADAAEKARKDFLESINKQNEPSEADKNRTELIRKKLMLGGELTDKELEHLKSKAPELYDDYINAENERKLAEKAYRTALKGCRSKGDVERLRQSTTNSCFVRAKNISENREMGAEQKVIRIAAEMRKASDVNSRTEEFRKSAEYRRLPEEDSAKRRDKKQNMNAINKERSDRAKAAYLHTGR